MTGRRGITLLCAFVLSLVAAGFGPWGTAFGRAAPERLSELLPSLSSTPATAAPDAPSAGADNVEFISHIGGRTHAVAVQGNYAYVGEGPSLTILDVTNPAAPAVVGRSPVLPEIVNGVAVAGNYAYVADLTGGLRIIDVANPAAPTEAGFFDTADHAVGVAVAGSYVYVADWDGGLYILRHNQTETPTDTPTATATLTTTPAGTPTATNTPSPTPTKVATQVPQKYTVFLPSISNVPPAGPAEVGFFDTPDWASAVAIAGGYVYVADIRSGLLVLDVGNPAAPKEIGRFNTAGHRA